MRKQWTSRVAALAVAVVVAGCGSTAAPRVEPVVSIPPREAASATSPGSEVPAGGADVVAAPSAELGSAFAELVEGVDGGAVAAVRVADGPLQLLAAGTDPDGIPLDAGAVVRVGSISKVFTSVLILDLVEEGALELDAPLGTVLDDPPIGATVTIRELLSHRSGIPNYTESPGFFSAVLRDPSRQVGAEEIFGFVDSDVSLFEPGERYAYSNTNYVLLGLVVEAVTGQGLNEVLAERVTDPLDLPNTSFDLGERKDVIGGLTPVSASGTASFDYTSVASSAWAAGSLVTTVEELAVFVTGLFDGRLLELESVAAMRAPLDAGDEYGLGLHGGPDFGVGHGGAILGFNSMLQMDPETGDLLILVVNNEQRRPDALTDAVWEAASGS